MVSFPSLALLIQNRPYQSKTWLEAQALQSDRLGLGCRLATDQWAQSLSFPIYMMDIARMLAEIKGCHVYKCTMSGP